MFDGKLPDQIYQAVKANGFMVNFRKWWEFEFELLLSCFNFQLFFWLYKDMLV